MFRKPTLRSHPPCCTSIGASITPQADQPSKYHSPALAPQGGEGPRGHAEGRGEIRDDLARSLVEEAGPAERLEDVGDAVGGQGHDERGGGRHQRYSGRSEDPCERGCAPRVVESNRKPEGNKRADISMHGKRDGGRRQHTRSHNAFRSCRFNTKQGRTSTA